MYNFFPIWVRIISFFIILAILITVIFLLEKKITMKLKIIISSFLVIISILLMLPTIKALIQPEIVTIEGSFYDEETLNGINPFERRYSFECNEKIISVDLDSLSKKFIYKDSFEKGELYTIAYEKTTNLVVYVSKIP